MFFYETFRLALKNLLLHKLRSLLTALGIIFGVAAVILMVSVGEGNKRKALADIERLGAGNIIVQSVKPAETGAASTSSRQRIVSYGITRLDMRRIEGTVTPISRIVPLKRVGAKVTHHQHQSPAEVLGTTPALREVASLAVKRGRYLIEEDLTAMENVAVIGAEIASRLFPLEDPLDSWVRVDEQVFRVVGVLRPVGLAGGAGTALVGRNLNFDVHIPLTSARSRFGDTNIQRAAGSMSAEQVEVTELYVEVADQQHVPAVAEQIRLVMALEHEHKGDVTITVPLELLEQRGRTLRMFNLFMIFIAGISLGVGGIGIMNIMLATVTERTREIGIRRAVGATRRHIILQFLVETTMLSAVGGVIGVGLGVGAVLAIAALHAAYPNLSQDMGRPHLTQWSIPLSFIVATAVGIIFGLYPAVKASRQDPIQALRHD